MAYDYCCHVEGLYRHLVSYFLLRLLLLGWWCPHSRCCTDLVDSEMIVTAMPMEHHLSFGEHCCYSSVHRAPHEPLNGRTKCFKSVIQFTDEQPEVKRSDTVKQIGKGSYSLLSFSKDIRSVERSDSR